MEKGLFHNPWRIFPKLKQLDGFQCRMSEEKREEIP